MPYRLLEGFIRALSRWEPRLKTPDYITTCRRVNMFDIGLQPHLNPEKPVTSAVDASGIKVSDRGEWILMKWRRRRGFLKIHIAVYVRTKQIVAMEVTEERTGDGGMLKPLVEHAETHCRVIKPRRSSRPDTPSPARRRAVQEFKDLGYEVWSREKGYSRRWAADTAFSTFKRLFGEHVTARSPENIVKKLTAKVALYQRWCTCDAGDCETGNMKKISIQ